MKLIDDFFEIKDIQEVDSCPIYTIGLNENHFIYKSHFPNNPITPGVCMLQMIEEILSLRMNRSIYLSQVNNIKFINVLVPEKDKEVKICFNKIDVGETSLSVKTSIIDDKQCFAKISTTYNYERL